MDRPVVSIIIATFNSEKTLPKVLESIKKQTLPQNKIEIILMDGGSTDKTFELGKQFHCRIINNPRTEPVFGKFLGYINAKGKYLMYLDHDEVIENKDSIKLKLAAFNADNKVKAVIGTGYKTPRGYPFINNYINEFGDPFSFFIYRLSKDYGLFIPTMKKRYKVFQENKRFIIFDLSKISNLPIIELAAGGSIFDADFLKRGFPETLKKYELLPHYFYFLHSKFPYIAVTKNDGLIHYSADTLEKYLNKIRWRVKNNIYYVSDMGESGFTGREKFQPRLTRLKKYFFIPYAFSIVFPLLDSLCLIISRKKISYLFHLLLSIYTANLIVYHSLLKVMGFKPKLKSYDESREVVRGV